VRRARSKSGLTDVQVLIQVTGVQVSQEDHACLVIAWRKGGSVPTMKIGRDKREEDEGLHTK